MTLRILTRKFSKTKLKKMNRISKKVGVGNRTDQETEWEKKSIAGRIKEIKNISSRYPVGHSQIDKMQEQIDNYAMQK